MSRRRRSSKKKTPLAVKAVVIAAILIWVGGCGAIIAAIGSSEPPTQAPRTTTPSQSAEEGSALAAAYDLEVADPDPRGYDREEFGQRWADVDRNGCDQRNDVLRRDLVKRQTKSGTNGCVLAKGVLKSSPYSGDKVKWTKGDTTIEIDHVVSLADAWRMGASEWSAKKRQKFANDPLNLEAVDADENQEKSDKNAVDYRPEEVDAECWFLARQASIKTTYELQVAEEEKAVFVDRLSSDDCLGGYRDLETSKDYKIPKPKPIGEPKAKPSPKPKPEPKQESEPKRNAYYKNCDAVRAAGADPIYRGDPGYARHLDRDGDGVGCES